MIRRTSRPLVAEPPGSASASAATSGHPGVLTNLVKAVVRINRPVTVRGVNPNREDETMNTASNPTPCEDPFDDVPAHQWLKNELMKDWDNMLFPLDSQVARDAALVFMLLTDFAYLAFDVEDIAKTFLWDISRTEQALDFLEQGLIEGHRRHPQYIAPMTLVRDPGQVWVRQFPSMTAPTVIGRL